jgi:hypothetical protein
VSAGSILEVAIWSVVEVQGISRNAFNTTTGKKGRLSRGVKGRIEPRLKGNKLRRCWSRENNDAKNRKDGNR